jgi:hypothetical protein
VQACSWLRCELAAQSFGAAHHVAPGYVEARFVSIIWIGDGLAFAAFNIAKQKTKHGRAVRRFHRLKGGEIIEVERHNVAEPAEIVPRYLPRAVSADINAVPLRDGLRSRVWRFAGVPITDACRVNHHVEAEFRSLTPERCFGKR